MGQSFGCPHANLNKIKPRFFPLATRVWGLWWYPQTVKGFSVGFYVQTTVTIQCTYLCVPDCIHIESTFINLIQISPYDKSPCRPFCIKYQFKRDVAAWHGCLKGTRMPPAHAANLVANSGNAASRVWSIVWITMVCLIAMCILQEILYIYIKYLPLQKVIMIRLSLVWAGYLIL